jgi:hypothetical protein
MTKTTDEVIDRVMRVVDGKIVEAAGYSKTAPAVAALES